MTVKPIDIKNSMSRTQQMSKIMQVENDRQKNEMFNQNINQNNKIKKELHQVNSSKETYKGKINKEKEKNKHNKNSQDNKKDKNNNKHENKDEIKSTLGSRIDIKV